jgi:hypothetical protein
MAYFGNSPISASYLTDYFSGNNTTVAFTLSRAPVSASAVIITISGVKQAASTYGVSGTTLTFSAAPPSGTNNIEVLHLGVGPDTVVQPSYRTITEFTATSGQTTFSPASYTAGYIDVFRNGVKLGSADFTATNGTTVVLNNACTLGDYVRFEGFLITSFNNAIPNTNGAVGDSLIASVSASKLTGSRTLPNSVVPAGSVLQCIQVVDSTATSFTSTTFANMGGMSASITPSSASSKILILLNMQGQNRTAGLGVDLGILRNGSNCYTQNHYSLIGGAVASNPDNNGQGGMAPVIYLDSPSSSSAITYTFQMRLRTGNGGTFSVNYATGATGTVYSTITLMEIAG